MTLRRYGDGMAPARQRENLPHPHMKCLERVAYDSDDEH